MSSASTRQADRTRIWDLGTGDCLFHFKDGFGSGLFVDGRRHSAHHRWYARWSSDQDLRVAQAVHLLATTAESLDDVAARVGYADAVTLLRKKTGRGVRALRRAP